MVKPIFIVRLPCTFRHNDADVVREAVGHNLGDEYKVLVLIDMKRKGETNFECYNANHSEIEWQTLEERVDGILKNYNNE